MGILVFIFIAYAVLGDRKNIFTKKQFSTLKKVIGWLIVLSIFSSALPSALFATVFLGIAVSPVAIVILALIAVSKQKKVADGVGAERSQFNASHSRSTSSRINQTSTSSQEKQQRVTPTSSTLPRQASKRRGIIEKFNKKYDLNLTDDQIQKIVDASYYSTDWAHEVEDMSKEYTNIYEWFQGSTSWLRAYLSAFAVQSVSSDFDQQEQICMTEFAQLFEGTNFDGCATQEDSIRAMNDKFFTNFDDISFMIAYRFLEKHGKHYSIFSGTKVANAESDTDDLIKKYESMSEEELHQKVTDAASNIDPSILKSLAKMDPKDLEELNRQLEYYQEHKRTTQQ